MADPKASWENRRFRGQMRPGRTGSNGLETREHTDRTEEVQGQIGELEGADQAGHIKRDNDGIQPGSTSGSSRVTKIGNRQGEVGDILAEKSESGDVQQNSHEATVFQEPRATATGAATMLPVGVPAVVNPGSGYAVSGELSVLGGTFSEQAVLVVGSVKTILNQNEVDYSPGEGTGSFTAGTGYTVSDTITMSDGTVVVVDAISGGAITQFHITTISATPHTSNGDTITQSFTTGEPGGSGFTMTLGNLNQGVFAATHKIVAEDVVGIYTVLPTDPVATSGAPFGVNDATFNIDWGVKSVAVTAAGIGYEAAPAVSFNGAGSALAVEVGGSIVAVTVIAPGSGYTSTALVTIADPP
jgi:hypothetical protein